MVSKFAFKFNLCRYSAQSVASAAPLNFEITDEVGSLYELHPVDPYLETTRFQPLNLSSHFLVSFVCFQTQLAPLQRGARVRPERGGAPEQGVHNQGVPGQERVVHRGAAYRVGLSSILGGVRLVTWTIPAAMLLFAF
jgi:hypothetical protein